MSDKIGEILIRKNIISEFDLKAALEKQSNEPRKYLGQILCEMGLPQSRIVKAIYGSNKRKPFGQVLVDLQIITAEQLSEILQEQQSLKKRGDFTPLGILLAQKKIITEAKYVAALAAHFSMPVVSLKNQEVIVALQQIIGEAYAAKNRMIVLKNSPHLLTLAIAEPNWMVFEYLEKLMPKGKSLLFYLARASEIRECLERKYDPFGNRRIKY
jgi:hypothetical protein